MAVARHVEKQTVNGDEQTDGLQHLNVIEALLRLALVPAPVQLLDVRLAACECIRAFTENHPGIRVHFLRRAIDGHTSGEDQIPNLLTILVNPPETKSSLDPYQIWLASVLLFQLLHDDPETKALAMGVTEGDESSGEEVITCVQAITGNLITGMQRNDEKRISVGYLMLLCGWLFEDPDAVNDFLGEGSSIQSLIQETKQCVSSKTLLPGLCAVLLGIIYEFSTKDSPIPRTTLHHLLMEQLGRELYIDRITKLREHPLVRDFEVLPQTSQGHHDGGLPKVFFDKIFIDFLKDNFSRLIRAIDREPGLEVPVIANGIQKGISRELVDSLRAQVEDKTQTIQTLETEMLSLQRKLEQEHLDHRKTKESSDIEISRVKHVNGMLQKTHEDEVRKLEEQYKHTQAELTRLHDEQLRSLDGRLKEMSTEYEAQAAKVRERNDAEMAELKETIQDLQSSLNKATADHIQDLATAHEQYSSKISTLEGRCKRAEEREEEERGRVAKLGSELKKAKEESDKFKEKAEENEKARNSAQNELEDLLIVFADLEAKRNEDKVSLCHFHCLLVLLTPWIRNDSKLWARMSLTLKTKATTKMMMTRLTKTMTIESLS